MYGISTGATAVSGPCVVKHLINIIMHSNTKTSAITRYLRAFCGAASLNELTATFIVSDTAIAVIKASELCTMAEELISIRESADLGIIT